MSDIDVDGLTDTCEGALAQAFAPLLRVTPDCVWDDGPSDGGSPVDPRLGGDYSYAVQGSPDNPNRIRLAYLPAYYVDCGSPYYPQSWFGSHSGDSEFIMIDVSYDVATGAWLFEQALLSAHCGTPAGIAYCHGANYLAHNWRGGAGFDWYQGVYRGAPIVWVSTRKHANYSSHSECNHQYNGFTEECSNVALTTRFPVVNASQNIGSGDYPTPWRDPGSPTRDCLPPYWGSERLLQINPNAYSYTACWWNTDDVHFDGWVDPYGSSGDGYGTVLAVYAGFTTGQSEPPGEESPDIEIAGGNHVLPGSTCTHSVIVHTGTEPFEYKWRVNYTEMSNNTSGDFTYTNDGNDYLLDVRVTDATYGVRVKTLQVHVSSSGLACFEARAKKS
jgi:hypothetical protein